MHFHRNYIKQLSLVLIIFLNFTFILQPALLLAENKSGLSSKTAQGIDKFKSSFDGAFSPGWFIRKFGIKMAYHLIDCIEHKKSPSVKAVIKSMMTADYIAGSLGGMVGGAAGSFLVPFLVTVPIFGGLLADFVPTVAYYLGASISRNAVKEAKSGKFSIKNVFKKIDWLSVVTGGVGWAAGSMLCSAIFPPIGGIVGGIFGDYIMGKVADKIRKYYGKGDVSPPTGSKNGGPVTFGENGTVQPELAVQSYYTLPSESQAKSLRSAGKIVVLKKQYEKLYKSYIGYVKNKHKQKALNVAAQMNKLRKQINDLVNK